MKARIFDKKHNAYALFQLGSGGGKLFSIPSVLECVGFEAYERQHNFSFDEDRDNYEVSWFT